MLGDVCAIVMGGHSSPPLAVLIVIIFLIEQSLHVATQINETAAAYQAITSRHVRLWFEETPQYSVALPGDSVFFSCRTNLPIAEENVTWVHNATKHLARIPASYKLSRGEVQGHLSFRVDTDPANYLRQTGDYRCIAGSRNRFIASLPAKLRIAHLDDFQPLDRPEVIEAFVGNDVVIGCKVPDSIPPPFVQFFRDDVHVAEEDSTRFSVLNGNTLVIEDVQSFDSGNYTCSASNHITDEIKVSSVIAVLKVLPAEGHEKARLIYQPEERYSVRVGHDLSIPCASSGVPKPEIIWTRRGNNTVLPSNHGVLTLTNAKESNAGSYLCAIFNGARRYVRQAIVTVLVPPKFTKRPHLDKPVTEGTELELPCSASGFPIPTVEWTYNGQPITTTTATISINAGTLKIGPVTTQDSGIYQCFVSNEIGQNVTGISLDVRSSGADDDEDEEYFAVPPFVDPATLSAPSKPNTTQLSPDSVMISWDVPESTVLPIKFFKIQFREFLKGIRSPWKTVDDIIAAEARAFEVLGLQSDRAYKFRVIAVYENNDNKPGGLSKKFRLDPHSGDLAPRLKAPSIPPEITEVLPLGRDSLRIGWTMDRRAFVSKDSVEGYFIYFRAKSGPTNKITIMGSTSHSHIIDGLIPGTEYEIKIRAFNLAGTSPASRSASRATEPDPQLVSISMNETRNRNESDIETIGENQNAPLMDGQIMQYLITGGALAGSVLVLVACCSAISYAIKRRKQKNLSPTDVSIATKYLDTSRQISLMHDQRTTTQSDVGTQRQSGCDTQTSQVFCETSFSSPSLGVSEDPLPSSSRWVLDRRREDDVSLSSLNERASLGGEFQEYTDEPSRLSWRRTRRSDECLQHRV